VKTVQLRKDHSLDDSKTFAGSIFEIKIRFFPIQAMEKFPSSIAKIKERFTFVGY
jgi:hypothetical protein